MLYFDGHEREDVVAYRQEWARRIMTYREYSETYEYDDVSVGIPPTFTGDIKQHVFVTHDESTFYANDHQKYAWLEKTESFILPKSQGRSIMISEFHCPCHGTMRGVISLSCTLAIIVNAIQLSVFGEQARKLQDKIVIKILSL